jgi:hypothetical protein
MTELLISEPYLWMWNDAKDSAATEQNTGNTGFIYVFQDGTKQGRRGSCRQKHFFHRI